MNREGVMSIGEEENSSPIESTSDKYFMSEMDKVFQPNHGPDEKGVYFTEEDYQELQRNLILYKQGNQEAVTYIVRTFHPFITKYTRFIKFGNVPYSHYIDKRGVQHKKVSPTIAQFTALFIDKTEKTKDRAEKKKVFSQTCYKIKNLFNKYEYGDIYNELVLALLNMANKYKITKEGDQWHKKNGTFHMYVSKCFHWEAYRFLTKLVNDPLTHFEVVSLRDQFDDFDDDVPDNEIFIEDTSAEQAFEIMLNNVSRQNDIKKAKTLTMKESSKVDAYDLSSLNFNWTNGVTCSELFSDLTPYEREIIVYSFIEKRTDIDIGKIYGCHRATINEHKKRAVRKIKEKALELNLI